MKYYFLQMMKCALQIAEKYTSDSRLRIYSAPKRTLVSVQQICKI